MLTPPISLSCKSRGRGEMAYAAGLGPVGGNTVGVQIPPPALGLSTGSSPDHDEVVSDSNGVKLKAPAGMSIELTLNAFFRLDSSPNWNITSETRCSRVGSTPIG